MVKSVLGINNTVQDHNKYQVGGRGPHLSPGRLPPLTSGGGLGTQLRTCPCGCHAPQHLHVLDTGPGARRRSEVLNAECQADILINLRVNPDEHILLQPISRRT